MKNILKFFALIMMAIAITACSSKDKDEPKPAPGEYEFTKTTTTVISPMGDFVWEEATYSFEKVDLSKGTATIVIKNIKFIGMMPVLSQISMVDVPAVKVENNLVFAIDEIVPLDATGTPTPSRTITNFTATIDTSKGTLVATFSCMGMPVAVVGSK